MSALAPIILTVLPLMTSQIKRDETVVFYPVFARLDGDAAAWTFRVHGKIYEPEQGSWRRGLGVATLRRALRVEKDTPEAETFDRRVRLFLVDNEGGKEIAVRIGPAVYPAGTSGANGHFEAAIRLPAAEAEKLLGRRPAAGPWIRLEAVTRQRDRRRFTGRVQLIGREGLSIISDIDDTIKHTQVRQRSQMLANTFLREFKPVPGMAALYQRAARAGAAVHYVSGSPWQLYEPLEAFCRREGFPPGSFHLKHFRLKDSTALDVLGSQEDYKAGHIEPILAAFPGRRFLLVGDSGEQDPEIYGRLARQHPEQVAAVWIRNVTVEKADSPRMRAAFEGVAPNRWRLFDRAGELEALLDALTARREAPPQQGLMAS